MRIRIVLLALLVCCPALSSCSIYRIDIRQGNFVTPDMREKLALGMTRQQVRYVLGTPMLTDPFHADRWDYVYRLEHDGKVVDRQNLTLYFKDDKLARIVDGSQSAATAPATADSPAKGPT